MTTRRNVFGRAVAAILLWHGDPGRIGAECRGVLQRQDAADHGRVWRRRSYDTYARVLAEHIGRHIPGNPKSVVVNMEGAGSLRLANWLYNAAPKDGTVFGITSRAAPFASLIGTRAAPVSIRPGTTGSAARTTRSAPASRGTPPPSNRSTSCTTPSSLSAATDRAPTASSSRA